MTNFTQKFAKVRYLNLGLFGALLTLGIFAMPAHADNFLAGNPNVQETSTCTGPIVGGYPADADAEANTGTEIQNDVAQDIANEYTNPNDFNDADFYVNPQNYCISGEAFNSQVQGPDSYTIRIRLHSGSGTETQNPLVVSGYTTYYLSGTYTVIPPPTAYLRVTSPTITKGNLSSLVSSCTNSTSASITNNIDTSIISPSATSNSSSSVSPQTTTKYTLACTGAGGTAYATGTVTVNVPSTLVPSCNVSPNPQTVNGTVTWNAGAAGGTPPYSYSWSGNSAIAGKTNSSVRASYSTAGTESGSVTVTDSGVNSGQQSVTTACTDETINALPVAKISVVNSTVTSNDTDTLNYECDNSTSGSINNSVGAITADGSQHQATTAALTTDNSPYTFTLTCNGPGGTDTNSVQVNVNPPAPATPTGLTDACSMDGTSVSLGWAADTNATSYNLTLIDNTTGVPQSDTPQTNPKTYTINPDDNYTWSLSAVNAGGPSSDATASFSCPAPLPDLTASDVSISPSPVALGSPATVSATISNSNVTSTSGPFPDLFQEATDAQGDGATVLGTYANPRLAANGTTNASISGITFPTAGTFYVRACANENSAGTNIVSESDYGNNCSPDWTAVTVNPAPPAPPTNLGAQCSADGTSASFSWTPSSGATSYGINLTDTSNNSSQNYSANTSPQPESVTPGDTYQWTMDATGDGGSSSNTSGNSFICYAPPSCHIIANPTQINPGQSSNITWTSLNTSSCTVTAAPSGFSTGGATFGGPVSTGALTTSGTDSYDISCQGQNNTTCYATVANVVVTAPTATLTANPKLVVNEGTTALTWSSTDATSCSITRDGAAWTTPGTQGATSSGNSPVTDTTPIAAQTKYVLTCTDQYGNSANSTAIVNVPPVFQNF